MRHDHQLRRSLLLTTMTVVGLFVVGCNSSTQGAATPAMTRTSPAPISTSGGGGGVRSASVKPCTLLDSQDVAHLGLLPGTPFNHVGATGCAWALNGKYTVAISYLPTGGLKDVNLSGETSKSESVGSHDALQFSDVAGCSVALAITKSSSVEIETAANSEAQDCQLANQYAELIEPKLPAEQK